MGFFDYPENPQESGQRTVPVLEGLSDEDWEVLLQHAEHRVFATGDVLIAHGEKDSSVYLLVEGTAEVVVPGRFAGDKSVSVINAGSAFGEIGFFDRRPRIVTVRALSSGSLVRITRQSFDELAAWQPALARQLLFDLGNTLAARLRQAVGIMSV
jgi:CRP/FNR family cyclic AMP-dependent transcriptional regulator